MIAQPASSARSTSRAPRQRQRQRRHGAVVIMMAVLIIVLIGFVSLAVDYGRVQIVKSELQGIADAAARAAARELPDGGQDAARDAAQAIALANHANGAALNLPDADVQIGLWHDARFTPGGSSPNAVRVFARCSEQTDNPVPLIFAAALGWRSVNVTAKATAVVVAGVDVDATVSGHANPWLAGMPSGTKAGYSTDPAKRKNYTYTQDRAPSESPLQVAGIPLVAGNVLTFDSISGDASHDPDDATYEPDGKTQYIRYNREYDAAPTPEHGKSNVRAPVNAIMGVFLDDTLPTSANSPPMPSMLDFSTPGSREFTSLEPQLKQMFFIGDGLTSDGAQQKFVVPEGATRLYIGMMDGYEWSNNGGYRTIKVARPMQIMLVE